MMNHILPDLPTERGTDYDKSLGAFLRLFYCYLSKARRQEKGSVEWVLVVCLPCHSVCRSSLHMVPAVFESLGKIVCSFSRP